MQNPARARRSRPSSATRYRPEEWDMRVKLAACYRLAAHFQMTDLIYTHFTARVPGPERHFLINPYGMMFHEVTASSLVKLDLEGNVVEDSGYPVNQAGFIIHSAVHRARSDAHCVLHTHTQAGCAVSAMAEGLLPISQFANFYYGGIAYHDYEGLALDPGECDRLAGDLGDKNVLILRNHGLLTCGDTVGTAFSRMLNMEKACRVQVSAMAGGRELYQPPPEVCRRTAEQFQSSPNRTDDMEWQAMLRLIADQEEDYAH